VVGEALLLSESLTGRRHRWDSHRGKKKARTTVGIVRQGELYAAAYFRSALVAYDRTAANRLYDIIAGHLDTGGK
jgi:hypothetical protein